MRLELEPPLNADDGYIELLNASAFDKGELFQFVVEIFYAFVVFCISLLSIPDVL